MLNFDTVSRDLERALASAEKAPADAVTAACSTVESGCRSILIEFGDSLPDKKDIKALFGAIRKPARPWGRPRSADHGRPAGYSSLSADRRIVIACSLT